MTKSFRIFILMTVIICLPWQIITAQEKIPDLITDRPDQTESSVTVPHHSLQIEIGGLFENDKNSNWENSFRQYPGALLRYGLLPNFELRFGGAFGESKSINRNNAAEDFTRGLNPLSAGFKVFISEENGIWPELAFIGSVSLPRSGHPDFRLDYFTPSFLLAGSHSLAENLGLGWNLGAEWESFNPKPNGIYSVVLGISASNRLGIFIESYGRYAMDEAADHRMDAGMTYLLMPNFQLDASAGMGISEAAPDYFVSFGASFRILR